MTRGARGPSGNPAAPGWKPDGLAARSWAQVRGLLARGLLPRGLLRARHLLTLTVGRVRFLPPSGLQIQS